MVLERVQAVEPWDSFATRIDDMLDPTTLILLQYYSQERLFSDEARIQFMEPDLAELPGFNIFDLTSGYSDGRTQN